MALMAADDSKSLCLLRVDAASGRLEELHQPNPITSFFVGTITGAGFLFNNASTSQANDSEDVLVVALGECSVRITMLQYQHKLLLWDSMLGSNSSHLGKKSLLSHCLSTPPGGLQSLTFRPSDNSFDSTR